MQFKSILEKLSQMHDLTQADLDSFVMGLSGNISDAEMAAFLIGMRMKGETEQELAYLVQSIRKHSIAIKPKAKKIADICGTGADMMGTFNISTCAALVAAGAGINVAKHGNGSASGKCGSADVLRHLGFNIGSDAKTIKAMIEKVGIGFLFAPAFCHIMARAAQVRKQLGIRTMFNTLGPLLNPASPKYRIVGVNRPELTKTMAIILKKLGCKAAMIVHGSGMDEISICGTTKIAELRKGRISTCTISPEDFGLKRISLDSIKGGFAQDNARMLVGILKGERGPRRDLVLLNAGALIHVCGKSRDIQDGILVASNSIDSGSAYRKLKEMIEFSGGSHGLS